jgi:hypothetical protein
MDSMLREQPDSDVNGGSPDTAPAASCAVRFRKLRRLMRSVHEREFCATRKRIRRTHQRLVNLTDHVYQRERPVQILHRQFPRAFLNQLYVGAIHHNSHFGMTSRE